MTITVELIIHSAALTLVVRIHKGEKGLAPIRRSVRALQYEMQPHDVVSQTVNLHSLFFILHLSDVKKNEQEQPIRRHC